MGTPKGRLTALEKDLLDCPWKNVRENVRVKLLPKGGETYVFAQSEARVAKERSMRRRRLRKYLKTLADLNSRKTPLGRDDFHQALVAAKKQAGRDARHVQVEVAIHGQAEKQTVTFTHRLDRKKLRVARRREGRYLLRTNLSGSDPAKLWEYYLQLTEIEQAFKELKGDLAIRPIHHQLEHRIESHMLMPSPPGSAPFGLPSAVCLARLPAARLISFLAYCLQVTLKARLKPLARGLTPRTVFEKFAAVQMLDVALPTTDGREIVLTRYTQPEKDLQLLLEQLNLNLPEQAPQKIHSP